MVARVYQPDHTGHIRQRLKSMWLYFTTGIVIALLGAAMILWIAGRFKGRYNVLVTVVWMVDIAAFLVAAIGLLITLIMYLVYRRRRADLDAAGAEVDGEFRARLHLRRRSTE